MHKSHTLILCNILPILITEINYRTLSSEGRGHRFESCWVHQSFRLKYSVSVLSNALFDSKIGCTYDTYHTHAYCSRRE